MNTQTLIFCFMVILVLTGLVWLAAMGNLLGIVALAILTTILLVAMGAIITLISVKFVTKKEQQTFLHTAKENLSIMQAMQAIQNQQNTQLLKQVKQLPAPQANRSYSPVFEIEPGVFEDLED